MCVCVCVCELLTVTVENVKKSCRSGNNYLCVLRQTDKESESGRDRETETKRQFPT